MGGVSISPTRQVWGTSQVPSSGVEGGVQFRPNRIIWNLVIWPMVQHLADLGRSEKYLAYRTVLLHFILLVAHNTYVICCYNE